MKNNHMKSAAAIALAVIIACSSMVGCTPSKANPAGSKKPPVTQQSTQKKPAQKKPVTKNPTQNNNEQENDNKGSAQKKPVFKNPTASPPVEKGSKK